MPSIGGDEQIGWFIAGLHGENDGADPWGNIRLWKADGNLQAAGQGFELDVGISPSG